MSKRILIRTIALFVVVAGLSGCRGDNTSNPVAPGEDVSNAGSQAYQWAIGPIEGFTTVWHPTPEEISVPVGTTVTFKCGTSPIAPITWIGATEKARDDRESFAEIRITPGRHEIVVEVPSEGDRRDKKGGRPQGTSMLHRCIIHGVSIKIDDIHVQELDAHVSPLGLDEESSNEATMRAFFAGGERFQVVSQLHEVANDHYVTALKRRVVFDAVMDPPEFSSLTEYRTKGKRPWLGAVESIVFDDVGKHAISVGPSANPREITLETYRVVMTSPAVGEILPDNDTVTFTATTEPPGFEDYITWVSSTKFGTASPVTGTGASFSVDFGHTVGPHPDGPRISWRWLGARADNAVFNFDTKGRMGAPCEIGIWEYVGQSLATPPNGALYLGEPLPCGSLPPVGPVAPPNLVSRPITGATVETYTVTGANLAAACANIFATTGPVDPHDGKHHAGRSDLSWTPVWSAPNPPVNGMITVHIDDVTWTIKVILPNWTPPPADAAAWANLISELEKHEQGHVDRYAAGMANVKTALVCQNFTIAATATDAQIDAAATALGKGTAAWAAMETSNANYDAPHNATTNPTGTNHGTENGQAAVWP